MKKDTLIRFGIIILTVMTAATLILGLHFGSPKPQTVPTATETGTDGNPITTVNIGDISECNTIRYANYTPDRYLIPQSDLSGEVVDLTTHTPAASGTYEFIIVNLDPWDEAFQKKSAALSPFLHGDNCWHFTLYLPACFSACNVYVRSVLFSRTGDLSGYDFIEYSSSNYQGVTERHASATEPQFIDVSFYTRRQAISEDFLNRAVAVTVHYEAEEGRTAGLKDLPLIGLEEAVQTMAERSYFAIEAPTVVAALLLSIFVFMCILKKSFSFIPYTVLLLGLLGFFLSAFCLSGATALPYFWSAISSLSPQLVIFSAFGILRIRYKKFPVQLPFMLLSAVNCLLAALIPYSVALQSAVCVYMKASNGILAAAIGALTIIFTVKKIHWSPFVPILPLLTAALALSSIFLRANAIAPISPLFWLNSLILFVVLCFGFSFFTRLEKQNIYLTKNLQSEVARQTSDLKEIIGERDTLLQYLSHDMKKPVHSMRRFLATLRERESNEEQKKIIDVVDQKSLIVAQSLDDLQKYSKRNYVMELSESFDVYDVLYDAYDRLAPDCEANSIILRLSASHVSVFAKRNMLKSVLDNLIFNSIEHSGCSEIALSVGRYKNICRIMVTDDGKITSADKDIFRPYFSENEIEENLGLGLYISKQHIAAMGGELSRDPNAVNTTFTITLPLA